ncbi:FG-GAP repeat protein [bacterium]|nr:FG-GAP repeat protein [bacterium]
MGDADGDGLADFFVSGGESNTAFVVLGPVTTSGLIGDLPNVARLIGGDYSAFDRAGTGDVNGDGLGDLVTGIVDRDVDWEYGAAIILAPFSGTMVLDDADYLYRGEGENSWAGSSVSSAGDVDADGLMDVLIGASATQVHSEYRGKAYLFYGADL